MTFRDFSGVQGLGDWGLGLRRLRGFAAEGVWYKLLLAEFPEDTGLVT